MIRSALECYQRGGNSPYNYNSINLFLRDDSDKHTDNRINKIMEMIYEIDSHMKNNDLEGTIYFRGIATDIKNIINNNDGVIINKSYTSCSRKLVEAKKYTDDSEDGCCILVFSIPPNIKTHIFGNQKEGEVLIERNTQFIIDTKNSRHPLYNAVLSKWSITPLPIKKKLHDFMLKLNKNIIIPIYDITRVYNI